MNVKEAIAQAKTYIRDVYAEEEVSNLGLEETLYDDGLDQWRITLGFSRPWNTPRTSAQALLDKIGAFDGSPLLRKRVIKVVTIDRSGKVISMRNREVADTDGMKGPLAIDANVLLLLIVGSAERHYIAQHKRLKAYTLEDFDLLVYIIQDFPSIILLPNTLTEVSNFARNIADPAKSHIARTMRALVEGATENFVPSKVALRRKEFTKLGLTDAALLEFASINQNAPAPTLLTVDLDLKIAAEMEGYLVENFNHYRQDS